MSNCQDNFTCDSPQGIPDPIRDHIPNNCSDDGKPSLKRVAGRPEQGWDEPPCSDYLPSGVSGNCDPMQAGKVINDPSDPSPHTIYRYAKAVRGCDEGMTDLFKGVVVLDDYGKAHNVPIIYGTQERAVAAITSSAVRKDDINLVVDRPKLPLMSICNVSYQFNQNRYIYHKAVDYMREFSPNGKPGFVRNEGFARDTVFGVARGIPIDISYTLSIWTMSIEDMNQIFEQVVLKFSPMAYIRVRGVGWEIGVTLDSISNNIDIEPGDSDRVIKFEFGFTAQTFIPQPITRTKTVLKTRTEFLDGLSLEDASSVISRLEEAVKGFQ